MFSDLSSFLYKYVGGISPDEKEPGFVHTILRPAVDCGMESARALHESMHGEVLCDWAKKDGKLTLSVKVPFGCRATLYLPAKYAETLTENGTSISEIGTVTADEKGCAITLACGAYQFEE